MWRHLTDAVREQQALFDSEVASWIDRYTRQGGKLFCGKGCSNCCTLAVNCTFPEALRISASLSALQSAKVREHTDRLLTNVREIADLKSYLRMHRQRIGYCPFLDDDCSCGIYQERPFSCRALLSTRESRWCGLDFAELSSEEKRAFVESLDRNVTSFPLHYVAATQDRGRALETETAENMASRFGFSLYGNLPFLVHLEREHHLSRIIPQGIGTTTSFLDQNGLLNPFLVTVDRK
ncbi:YkgJ family cysteine cluster protein [Geobacter sp. AOG1]|uniref:YkgJ family cysteine cluster protein n=1 Tax=Geobacter sp. AOG1 TaxID=1566346 RepID=UPI001CC40F3A|nr:YkgJ family cysteine cluster protein [Geobacter sp. AOG1]GFE59308.1 zinc/iron-chelating domain-containing protein [Geobacter sp. AOG1]